MCANSTKVLIVEDNFIAQKVHVGMLTALNCRVELAPTGLDAIKKIQAKYDVIFMDMDLPDLHGCRVTEIIKAIDNPNQNTPVIALTQCRSNDIKQKCFDLGMAAYINKPITQPKFKELLDYFSENTLELQS